MSLLKLFHRPLESGLYFMLKRHAGHSKWANIRHIKSANDQARSKLFWRFAQQIKISIQEKGDPNPETNRRLANIVESAKRASMPITSIQNAIKGTQGSKSRMEEWWFEMKGPKGCFIIVEVITDNRKRTKDTLSSIAKKNNVSFTENLLRVMFTKKALVEAEPPDGVKDMDNVLEHAIESGAEDVEPTHSENPTSYLFYSDPHHLETTKLSLEKIGYKILEADVHFIPNSPVSLGDDDMAAVAKLCDKLEEHPDVVRIYDNIA